MSQSKKTKKGVRVISPWTHIKGVVRIREDWQRYVIIYSLTPDILFLDKIPNYELTISIHYSSSNTALKSFTELRSSLLNWG